MFKRKAQAYKQRLVEEARPYLEAGEEIRVLALAQAKIGPWAQALPTGIGVALFLGSFGNDAYLPDWAGILGVLIVVAGFVLTTRVPRVLLLRTDERLYEFKLPGSSRGKVERPLAVHAVAELPVPAAGGRRLELAGKRLWANHGAPGERAAIARALDPADPRAAEGATSE